MSDSKWQPTWLYVKKCSHCDLLYFGKTIKDDPVKYKGSGVRWSRHLKKYKAEPETIWKRLFKKQEVCNRYALKFSRENDIVASNLWANCVEENGLDGGVIGLKLSKSARAKISAVHSGKPKSAETRAKMSANHSRHNLGKEVSDSVKKKISKSMIGKHAGDKNPMFGCKHSEESRKKIGENNVSFFGHTHSEEQRAKWSAERKGIAPANKGKKMPAHQVEMIRNRVVSDATRALIGAASKGRIHSLESRQKMSASRSGPRNPMYGKPSANRGKKWTLVNGKRTYYEP